MQWPDELAARPAGVAWRAVAAGAPVCDAPAKTFAWFVASGALHVVHSGGMAGATGALLSAFTRTVTGTPRGRAGTGGATVVGFLGGPALPPPATRPPATVDECRLVQLEHAKGWSVARGGTEIPFSPERAYLLFDVPTDAERGAHAHIGLHQLVVALRGAFEVELSDGRARRTEALSSAQAGLYVPPGLWRDLRGFSGDAICMVLASARYEPTDYIRDYDAFLRYRGHG